jgi:hypothetical protein
MSIDNTLYLPFIDESEIDTNKVTVNEFSFQNYISASLKFLKKLRKLEKISPLQRRQAGALREAINSIISRVDQLDTTES